ncbi:hypothetical protein ACVWXO_003770 [Bradyrhizobium sp. LM2.7]
MTGGSPRDFSKVIVATEKWKVSQLANTELG